MAKFISFIILLSAIYNICGSDNTFDNSDIKQEQVSINSQTQDSLVPDYPVSFGYKTAWLAIKSNDTEKIAELLNLINISKANWNKGIATAYDFESTAVFISPPVDEWVFVVGWSIVSTGSRESLIKTQAILNKLSLEFGEAQLFATHRIVDYHCWMKSVNGEMQRSFAYIGERDEIIIDDGAHTEIEKELNLANSENLNSQDETGEKVYPNEETAMTIAGRWSIDPTKLDNRKETKGLGLLGTVSNDD